MSPDALTRETVVARLRPHVRALFWPTLVLVLCAAAVGYLGGVLHEQWQSLTLAGVAVVVIVAGWLLPTARWLARNYTITTRRIVLRSGVFVRVRQELLHSRGYDVTVRKNALQSMFGSGDVEVNVDHDAPVVLRDVPSADLVQSALHDLMEHSQNSISLRRRRDTADVDDTTGEWSS